IAATFDRLAFGTGAEKLGKVGPDAGEVGLAEGNGGDEGGDGCCACWSERRSEVSGRVS
ncbi:MAG: hypothetical protein Q9210_007157, partial [Variospora velana]